MAVGYSSQDPATSRSVVGEPVREGPYAEKPRIVSVRAERVTPYGTAVLNAAGDFLGVALFEPLTYNRRANQWPEGRTMNVLEAGAAMVSPDTGVNVGDSVSRSVETGRFGKGPAGAGRVTVPGAIWRSSSGAGGKAVLRLSGFR